MNFDSITPPPAQHPWPAEQIFYSPGGHLCYRVVGPCCRLFDREQLPWPSCRLEWRGKEPSWRRIGKRFIPDLATRNYPSYAVQILDQGISKMFVMTLFTTKLSAAEREWWYSRKVLEPALEAEASGMQTAEVPPESPEVIERVIPLSLF